MPVLNDARDEAARASRWCSAGRRSVTRRERWCGSPTTTRRLGRCSRRRFPVRRRRFRGRPAGRVGTTRARARGARRTRVRGRHRIGRRPAARLAVAGWQPVLRRRRSPPRSHATRRAGSRPRGTSRSAAAATQPCAPSRERSPRAARWSCACASGRVTCGRCDARRASAAGCARRSAPHPTAGSPPSAACAFVRGTARRSPRAYFARDRLALELHRRRQLVAAGQPLVGQQRELLDLLDARELLVRLARPPGRRRRARARRAASSAERRAVQPDASPRAPARRRGRARSARRCRAARRRSQTAWPISGLARLERGLDVRGRHVLAGRVDDQLLLAVDDLQVAVVVELADVAGVQPAVVGRTSRASSRAGCGSRA